MATRTAASSIPSSIGVALCAAAGAFGPGCRAILDAGGYETVELSADCGATLDAPLRLVQSCMLMSGCGVGAPPFELSDCIASNPQLEAGIPVSEHDLRACHDVWLVQAEGFVDAECSGKPAGWRCEADRAILCDPALHNGGRYVDCARRGGHCVELGAGSGSPVADCQLKAPNDGCDDDAGVEQCKGTVLRRCDQGRALGIDCAALSSNCESWADASACYYAPRKGCPETALAPCNGNRAQSCIDSVVYEADCQAAGLRCEAARTAQGGTRGVCLAPGCTVSDANGCRESCSEDGKVARLCVGGTRLSVHCGLVPGFRCTAAGEGVGARARCAY
jgi:hypothetical protein